MKLLLHSILLAIATIAASAILPMISLAICLLVSVAVIAAANAVGENWRRTAVFLGGVSLVVCGGFAADRTDLMSLVLASVLLALLVVWANELGDGQGGSSMVFYPALVMVFFLLGGLPDGWPGWLRFGMAIGLLAISLVLWRPLAAARRFRQRRGAAPDPAASSMPPWVTHLAGIGLLILVLGGMFWRPLPWFGDRALIAGQKLRAAIPFMSGGGVTKQDSAESRDAESTSQFGRHRELPQRADLQLGADAMLHLRIEDPEKFSRFVTQRNYVRSWVLEAYAEDGWHEPESEPALYEDLSDGSPDGWVRLAPGRGIRHEIFLPAAGGAGLPAIHNPIGFQLDFIIQSAPDMYEAELRGAVRYTADSQPLSWERLANRDFRPAAAPRAHLLSRPQGEFGRQLQLLSLGLMGGARTSHEQLNSIRDFLRNNCTYSQRIENPDQLPPLENFLFGERVGYCDFFASAAALLAREAGFPARMAYGYSGGLAFPEQGVVSYRELDAHAWAEVLIEGAGWVVFDATPEGSGAARAPSSAEGVAPPDLSQFRDAEAELSAPVADSPEAPRRSFPGWARWALLALAGLVVAVVAWRLIRSESDEDEQEVSSRRDESNAPPYLREFLRLCREFGRPKDAAHTLREAIVRLESIGMERSGLIPVADYYYGITYADQPRDRARESELRHRLRELRKRGAPQTSS